MRTAVSNARRRFERPVRSKRVIRPVSMGYALRGFTIRSRSDPDSIQMTRMRTQSSNSSPKHRPDLSRQQACRGSGDTHFNSAHIQQPAYKPFPSVNHLDLVENPNDGCCHGSSPGTGGRTLRSWCRDQLIACRRAVRLRTKHTAGVRLVCYAAPPRFGSDARTWSFRPGVRPRQQ